MYDDYPPRKMRRDAPSDYDGDWEEPEPRRRPQDTPPPPPPQRPIRRGEIIKIRPAAIFVLLGVIIFFIGTILVQSTILVKPPEYDDYDDSEDYDKEREKYQDTIRNIFGVGKIFNWIGAMIIALPLYVMGISNERLDWKIRASMISTATAIVIATMIVTMFSPFPTYY